MSDSVTISFFVPWYVFGCLFISSSVFATAVCIQEKRVHSKIRAKSANNDECNKTKQKLLSSNQEPSIEATSITKDQSYRPN